VKVMSRWASPPCRVITARRCSKPWPATGRH
jgi:hypothetical protein